MRRRDLLAGGLGLAGLGAGSWYVLDGGRGHSLRPVTVETIRAAGSQAGTMRVPVAGRVTVVDVFSVGCVPCKAETRRLAAVRSSLGADVQLVSVTNDAIGGTLTRDDVRRWWRANDGDWPVALDAGGQLTRELSVTGLPTLGVVAPDGTLTYRHAGLVSTGDLRAAVQRARPT